MNLIKKIYDDDGNNNVMIMMTLADKYEGRPVSLKQHAKCFSQWQHRFHKKVVLPLAKRLASTSCCLNEMQAWRHNIWIRGNHSQLSYYDRTTLLGPLPALQRKSQAKTLMLVSSSVIKPLTHWPLGNVAEVLIFKLIIPNNKLDTHCEIALWWMLQNVINNKSTLSWLGAVSQ